MSLSELLILVPCHSLEDFPTELADEPAAGLLNAFAVIFHPALIAAAGVFPKYRRADETGPAKAGQFIILPTACKDWVPNGWVEHARREGAVVVSGVVHREEMLQAALASLPSSELQQLDQRIVEDFLALGTVYLQTELLTRHMRNYSHLDEALMLGELLAGAKAALQGENETARQHLRRCFEMLLDCREKFYPVDCYLIDICLMIPRLADEYFEQLLRDDIPTNWLAQGADWAEILREKPTLKELIAEGWKHSRLELLGGDWQEGPQSLMSLEASIDNLQRGRNWYVEQFGRAPVVWGRKRFGHGPHLPQLLSRMNYTGALHFIMDDGIYPDEELAKLRWQGSDGSTLDACSRIPVAGDSASGWLRFAKRMAESMDRDHSAGIFVARWPEMRTPWLNDLRNAARYAPVLGNFVLLESFFRATDTHGPLHEFKAGEYLSPTLVHTVARRESDPISRYTKYWQREWQFRTWDWCAAVIELFSSSQLRRTTDGQLQSLIRQADPEAEPSQLSATESALARLRETVPAGLSRVLTGTQPGAGQGVLIVNPLSAMRRILVTWPEGTAPVDGPGVLHRQVDEQQAAAVVEVPGCGFQWLPAPAKASVKVTSPGKIPMAEGLLLRTDEFEVQLSEVTGGIGQIRTYRRSPNRLSQQVAYRFPVEKRFTVTDGDSSREVKTFYSDMVLKNSRVITAGPALGCIETAGELQDPQQPEKPLATFVQRTTVQRGCPTIQVQLELNPLKQPDGDPWTNYYGLRFAWKSETAALSGSMQEGTQLVTSPRIEAPHFLEIADESYRTSIHFPGLTFHRKTGDRMLDTLLIVEGESARQFEFAIALDDPCPMARTWDLFSPPVIVPTQQAPPAKGHSGWLFHVGSPNVQIVRILPLPAQDTDERSGGFVLRLQETEGRHKTVPVHCFSTPSYCRQLDLRGETVASVPLENDALRVEIAAYEVCDLEIRF